MHLVLWDGATQMASPTTYFLIWGSTSLRYVHSRRSRGPSTSATFPARRLETIPHQSIDLDLLVAGISLPILMPPVHRGEYWYTDAVWIMDANVSRLRAGVSMKSGWSGASGNTPEYHRGPFQQYVHMIEMAANGSLFGSIGPRARNRRAGP